MLVRFFAILVHVSSGSCGSGSASSKFGPVPVRPVLDFWVRRAARFTRFPLEGLRFVRFVLITSVVPMGPDDPLAPAPIQPANHGALSIPKSRNFTGLDQKAGIIAEHKQNAVYVAGSARCVF